MTIPIFINCRDRLEPLLALLNYLERAGQAEIFLLDNDSAYPPLLEYFAQTPLRVIRLGRNVGRLALWDADILSEYGVTGRFVFSDPDIVPDQQCPIDAIEYFGEILDAFPDHRKAGFGLRIDDLPRSYRFNDEVVAWETQYWERLLAPRLYDAPIDATFALYRGPDPHTLVPAIRTGHPYVARHVPWYFDDGALPADEEFYRSRAEGSDVNHWGGETLPAWLVEAVAAMQSSEELECVGQRRSPESFVRRDAETATVLAQSGGPDVFDPNTGGGSAELNSHEMTKEELAYRLAAAEKELDELRATRTFRYTQPIRNVYGRFRRPRD